MFLPSKEIEHSVESESREMTGEEYGRAEELSVRTDLGLNADNYYCYYYYNIYNSNSNKRHNCCDNCISKEANDNDKRN